MDFFFVMRGVYRNYDYLNSSDYILQKNVIVTKFNKLIYPGLDFENDWIHNILN